MIKFRWHQPWPNKHFAFLETSDPRLRSLRKIVFASFNKREHKLKTDLASDLQKKLAQTLIGLKEGKENFVETIAYEKEGIVIYKSYEKSWRVVQTRIEKTITKLFREEKVYFLGKAR